MTDETQVKKRKADRWRWEELVCEEMLKQGNRVCGLPTKEIVRWAAKTFGSKKEAKAELYRREPSAPKKLLVELAGLGWTDDLVMGWHGDRARAIVRSPRRMYQYLAGVYKTRAAVRVALAGIRGRFKMKLLLPAKEKEKQRCHLQMNRKSRESIPARAGMMRRSTAEIPSSRGRARATFRDASASRTSGRK